MEQTTSERKALALGLIGLCVFLALQALELKHYIRAETRPPSWDQAIHLEIALDYRDALKTGRWAGAFLLPPKPGMPPFPPLYHLALTAASGGENPAGAALWVNWFYLALLCLSLFAVAYEFRPDLTALAAALIFACSPAVQELLLTQLADLAVAACAAAAYWALVRCDDFKNWGASLAFGLLCAAGMLHKWSFFSYLIPALYPLAKGLGERQSRPKAAAAAALAVSIPFPWYWAHAPVLLPRLVGASRDFGVPFWQSWAFLRYFRLMADGLGPFFWVLGLSGIFTAQYPRQWRKAWLFPAWAGCSYVFWSLVPNRQMRFLVPGLPALSVALVSAWPKPVVWSLAAFQFFSAANFGAGWISRIVIPMPLASLVVLPSQPPRGEDWRIADVLMEASRLRESGSPISNLTVVANSPYFNGPNFTWMAKNLKLSRVNIRGVNKRLCEFSEFVVLKTGELGPSEVISGLPEASQTILRKDGWFSRAYKEVKSWPLPDASSAVLYQRRRPSLPPFREKGFRFQYYASSALEAEDLRIEFGPWEPEAAAYSWVRISAGKAFLHGLELGRLSVELQDVLLVPAGEGPGLTDDVRFLKMGRLKIVSVEVQGGALKAFLERRIQGLKLERLDLDRTVRLAGLFNHVSFSAELALALPGQVFVAELIRARLGATPIPLAAFPLLRSFSLPLEPSPETPFALGVPGLTAASGRLSIP
ncbi:MAG: glycosyltransferase family 39 protein [Elusimicrobia bacterium]|nr:glycosyltransferase family 39 protein [Elusimicrobiota bacterium]